MFYVRLSLPSRKPKVYFAEILTSISVIESFVAGMDLELYRADLKSRRAIERELQIMTEAAIRLRDDAARLCPDVDWRGIRGLGNVLRHEYDDLDDEVIWKAIQSRLPLLKIAVQDVLTELDHAEGQA